MKDLLAAFPAVLERIDMTDASVEPLLFAAFRRAAGEAFSAHLVPLHFDNGRLLAAVSTETWRRNVKDLGPVIVDKLNSYLGRRLVRFVEFRIDPSAVREHRRRLGDETVSKAVAASAGSKVTKSLSKAAGTIANSDLRDRFLAAASNSLARKDFDQKLSE